MALDFKPKWEVHVWELVPSSPDDREGYIHSGLFEQKDDAQEFADEESADPAKVVVGPQKWTGWMPPGEADA